MRLSLPLLGLCLSLAGASAAELNLLSASSPLEGLLIRDQISMYLRGIEMPPDAGPYELRLEVRHRERRLFDYGLELMSGARFLGRQTGTLSFEEFRLGFGKPLETVLACPPEVQVVSLEEFRAPAGELNELRRLLVEELESTERILVLESADFAHHRLSVRLRGASRTRRVAELSLDGKSLPGIFFEGQDLWAPVLEIANRVTGSRYERVRLVLAEAPESGTTPGRPLRRGPMDYRLGSETRIRQSLFDGEGYPVLVPSGEKLSILRFGYLPRTIRLQNEPVGLKQVYLTPQLVSARLRILAPGHHMGPVRLLGYEGEELQAEDGGLLRLKRGYKYRYTMEVNQRGLSQLISGWFVVPEQGPMELYDERYPDNLDLSLEPTP